MEPRQPLDQRMVTLITVEMMDWLKAYAEEHNVSMADVVRYAVREMRNDIEMQKMRETKGTHRGT